MAIEINSQSGNNPVQNQQRNQPVTANSEQGVSRNDNATGSDNGRGTDTVSLTDTAARLQSIEAKLAEVPVVDTQRVDAIRQALNDGAYQVDAGNIADKLLAFESSLYK